MFGIKLRITEATEHLVGRVLHRHRRGHGLKSRSGLIFFSGFNFTTAKVVCATVMINHVFKVCYWPNKIIYKQPKKFPSALPIALRTKEVQIYHNESGTGQLEYRKA